MASRGALCQHLPAFFSRRRLSVVPWTQRVFLTTSGDRLLACTFNHRSSMPARLPNCGFCRMARGRRNSAGRLQPKLWVMKVLASTASPELFLHLSGRQARPSHDATHHHHTTTIAMFLRRAAPALVKRAVLRPATFRSFAATTRQRTPPRLSVKTRASEQP